MTFIESIKTVYKKYDSFSGRATRSEYWWFVLFACLTEIVFWLLARKADLSEYGFRIFGIFAVIFLYLPTIGLGIRRLHDIGLSGWWISIKLIPYLIILLGYVIEPILSWKFITIPLGIGHNILFLLFVTGSDGKNKYGPVPSKESAI